MDTWTHVTGGRLDCRDRPRVEPIRPGPGPHRWKAGFLRYGRRCPGGDLSVLVVGSPVTSGISAAEPAAAGTTPVRPDLEAGQREEV